MRDLVRAAPRERVLLTRGGKPFAFVSDASKYDEEDIGYMTDPAFWAMIAERRKRRGGVPLAAVQARIAAAERAERKEPGKKTPSKGTK